MTIDKLTNTMVDNAIKTVVQKHLVADLDIAEVKAVKKAERELLSSQNIGVFQAAVKGIKAPADVEVKEEETTLKILFTLKAAHTKVNKLSMRMQTKLNNEIIVDANGALSLNVDDMKKISKVLATVLATPKTFKDYRVFMTERKLEQEFKGHFSHSASVVTKPNKVKGVRRPAKWVFKTVHEGEQVARREVVAQEFLRFLMPWYPKTRLYKSGDRLGVLSKFVQSDHKELKENIKLNPFEFAQTCILSLAVGELDLRPENCRIDDQLKTVKTDGGKCFGQITAPERCKFTEDDVAASPFLVNPSPINYFDLLQNINGKVHKKSDSQYFKKDLSNNPDYRHGVNVALLKFICLTDELIQEFVVQYIDAAAEQDLLSKTLINTRNMFERAAFKNVSFKNYSSSEEVIDDSCEFLDSVKDFTTMGKNYLWDHLSEQEKREFEATLIALTGAKQHAEPNSAKLSSVSSEDTRSSGSSSLRFFEPPKFSMSETSVVSDSAVDELDLDAMFGLKKN